jgi:hypothetical protein
MATSLADPSGTWAVAEMGGSAAQHNNFWELFVRPARSRNWKLVTPEGAADNGGLVIANFGSGSLAAAVGPSQYLTFSPLSVTGDQGASWEQASPLGLGLASVPGALAGSPGGQLLALTPGGQAELAANSGSSWSALTSARSLAASPPGRACGLASLTAVAFSPSGMPLVAGACTHPGTAGIFAFTGSSWQAAGPGLPASLSGQPVRVLSLARVADRDVALLEAGTGSAASLLAAWSSDGRSQWKLSPPVSAGTTKVTSAEYGPSGNIGMILAGGRAEVTDSPGAPWRLLPALPPGTMTLALGSAGSVDALAVNGTKLADWRLTPSAGWRETQLISVPIQFGSSG